MKRKQQKQRKFNSVRHLRNCLGKTQQAFASEIAKCSRFSIESIETGRLDLSAELGARISAATGCDFGWLMSNDEKLRFVNVAGRPYAKEDAERASETDGSIASFWSIGPEIRVLVAADLLHRVLAAAQARGGAEHMYLARLENYVRSEVGRFAALQNEIYDEIRAAPSLPFLSPRSLEPFQRIRKRATAAIEALKAREKAIRK
jgi:DNA-binding XRE family transcriptional regulator